MQSGDMVSRAPHIAPLVDGWLTPIGSRRIRSQHVTLAPGSNVGRHETHDREEVIIVLAGTATVMHMDDTGKDRFDTVTGGNAVTIGVGVTHDIINQGKAPLSYIYVVALHHDPK